MDYITNIREWRSVATQDDVYAGRDWYPLAEQVTRELAERYGYGLDTVAGVIAVLSPQTLWSQNLRAAESVLRAHAAGESIPRPGDVETLYYENVRKAWNILAHGDGFPRCTGTVPGKRDGTTRKCHPGRDGCAAAGYLHGPKVNEFAETILGKRAGRVVDVWATRAAYVSPYDALTLEHDDVRRLGIPGTRMLAIQRAYAQVAEEFGEDPRDTQAVVWVAIRRNWRMPGRALQTVSRSSPDYPRAADPRSLPPTERIPCIPS